MPPTGPTACARADAVPAMSGSPRAGWRARRVALVVAALAAVTSPLGCSPGTGAPATPALPIAPGTGPALYVSTQGDDHNPGSRAEPLRTISKAAALARPGTTVVVTPGRYVGSVSSSVSGTRGARIVFTAQPPWSAQVVGEGTEAAWRNEGNFVDIANFDLSGNTVRGMLNEGSYVRIVANRIHDFTRGDCISTYNSGYTLHDIDIIGNVVHGCGSTMLDHGIYLSYTRGLIADNISYGNAGYGIHCWHNCGQLVISNNDAVGNGGGIAVGQGDSPHFGRITADQVTVSNNIVVDNRVVGIAEAGATGSGNRYLNNLLYRNGDDRPELRAGTQAGTITADPDFVDYGSGDYRLRGSSPGIDAGTDIGAPSYAIDGTPRPSGRGYDIGAYQR